jgi:uncharacterized membrane protein YbhN (UPF0104 family)
MTEQSQPVRRIRSYVMLALRGFLAAGILYLLFQIVSFSDVVRSFRSARVEFLVGAIALMFVNLGFQFLKWRYFVRLINPHNSKFESAASFLFGLTLGTITPGQIGEFGGRAMRHDSIPSGAIIGLTLVDRLQMICLLALGGGVSLLKLIGPKEPVNYLFGILLTAMCGVIFFNPTFLPSLIVKVRPGLRSNKWFQDFLEAVALFRTRQLLISLALSAVFYFAICAQMFLLLNAFSDVTWMDAFFGFAAMMFIKALVPISLGDLGVREASSVYFYSLVDIAPATSLNASLLLFVINILFPSLIGLFFFPRKAPK